MIRSCFIAGIIAGLISFSFNSFSQNVGIGNANPSEKLDVNGNINVSGTIKTNGVDGTANQVLMKDANGLLVWGDQCEFKNRAIFTNNVSEIWTVPAGVIRIRVEAWGSGGGGHNAGGGGGGGYVAAFFTVTPGSTINVSNGIGGTGGGTTGGTGEPTVVQQFGVFTVNAAGGLGGSGSGFGLGGAGTVTGGSINYIVRRGEQGHNTVTSFYNNGSTYYEQSLGGDGGHSGNSINTGGRGSYRVMLAASPFTVVRTMGTDAGKQPGGGGGSGCIFISTAGTFQGGAGGNGMTVISY